MNKIITYDPNKLEISVPAYYNKILAETYKNENIKYLTFIQVDLAEQCKDFPKFISNYLEFLTEWDLPYIFFPYYLYFNKMLSNILGKPNPKLEVIAGDKTINVVMSPAYGFLMLDVKKLKDIDFLFNESYTELFYLQDLIQICYEKNLWISNCCFLDRYHSWEDLKELSVSGYTINSLKFNTEKAEYEKREIEYKSPNEFLVRFKERYKL
jgi:hypothetical protein